MDKKAKLRANLRAKLAKKKESIQSKTADIADKIPITKAIAPIYYLTSCAKLRQKLATEHENIGKVAMSALGCPSGNSHYVVISTCAELVEKYEGQITHSLGRIIATMKILGISCRFESPTDANPRIFQITFEISPGIIIKRILVLNCIGNISEKIIVAQMAKIGDYVKSIIDEL